MGAIRAGHDRPDDTQAPGRRVLRDRAALLLAGAVALFLLLVSAPCGHAGEKGPSPEEEVDYLALAALLIKDGYYDRAESVLNNVDVADEELDRARFYTLRGLVVLHRGLHAQARDDFRAAVDAGQQDPIVYLYLAQALYGLQEYAATLEALERAGAVAETMPRSFLMKFQCTWLLGRKAEAFAVLDEAQARFPEQTEFTRQKVMGLVELGLYQEAVALFEAYLERARPKAEDLIALGEALRQAGQLEQSLVVLESAKLRDPASPKVLIALAHSYLDAGKERTAARLFETASLEDPKYLAEAAELYRRAGDFQRALYLNAQVPDQKKKARQRLGILLQMGNFEGAVSLEPRLSRLGLLEDGQIRYALAYTHYRTGHFERARTHLQQVRQPDLFRAVSDLMKAIDSCEQSGWQCI